MIRAGKMATMRLEKILNNDRKVATDKMLDALKGDLYELLSAYADVSSKSIKLNIEMEDGEYYITLNAKATRINGVSNINKL